MRFIYLKTPNTIRENAIGWPVDECLPPELNLHRYVDWDTQFEKTFISSVDNIIKAMKWDTRKRTTLDEFF
jgi:hypothetical protein